jgi:hypothetical protein
MKAAHKLLFENNLHESHWGLRIIEAEIKGYYPEIDKIDSESWLSCACGKLDRHVKTNMNDMTMDVGAPLDFTLRSLGVKFDRLIDITDYIFIGGKRIIFTYDYTTFYCAAETLVAIEKRSIELLEETLK